MEGSQTSLFVLIMLSSVLLIVTIIGIVLVQRYRKYHSRPYLLAGLCFLSQAAGIGGIFLISIFGGSVEAPFDTILRPTTLAMGFITLVLLLAYIVDIKFPGKMTLKTLFINISPFVITSAVLFLINPSPLHSVEEIIDGIRRPDVVLRLILVLLLIAYPIVAACQPYDWRKCLVSKNVIEWLHILSCILPPMFVAGIMGGFFPAVVANYIFAFAFDALIAHIELMIRIPVAEPLKPIEPEVPPEPASKPDVKPNPHATPGEPASPKLAVEFFVDRPEIWMNPDMTAVQLARIMGTNRTYLADSIKGLGYSSYSDMINRKRVEFICKELERGTDANIIDLMFEAGFRSRSTASYEFKRIVGCASSEYLKTLSR